MHIEKLMHKDKSVDCDCGHIFIAIVECRRIIPAENVG